MRKSIFNLSDSPLQRKKSNKVKNSKNDVVIAKDISYPVLNPADRQRKEFFGTISLWSDEQDRNLVEQTFISSSSSAKNIKNSSKITTKSTSSTPSLHVLSQTPSNNICNEYKDKQRNQDQNHDITKLRRSFSEKERKSVNLGKMKQSPLFYIN